MEGDVYKTILNPVEAQLRERGSRFIAFAYPVENRAQVKEIVDKLRKEHYDATHHCYAYRLGADGALSRANDDGEPSGTAGRPILGQLLSADITNCLVVVVRWFGGTKLGVPGLIDAYRTTTAEALSRAQVVERTVDIVLDVRFSYIAMNDVMRIVKEEQLSIGNQLFDNLCIMQLIARQSIVERVLNRLSNVDGVSVEIIEHEDDQTEI